MIPWLERQDPFPPVETALRDPNGLLAAGDDLSRERLLDAYRSGIFPWFNEGEPVLWWCPDPRMVLFLDELHVSRSLRKALRGGRFTVTFDRAFEDVMRGCAAPRDGATGTWITPVMLEAYVDLHAQGYAHSVEVWHGGLLAGGLYGVALGGVFFGESMFSWRSDASKVALVTLVELLKTWNCGVIDCQMATEHLASLGAREIPRRAFTALVADLARRPPPPPRWTDAGEALAARRMRPVSQQEP